MRDEAGLRAARAVAEPEAEHRLAGFADKAGDAVVEHRHGEQRARAFLGLHAARRDERDDGKLPPRAFHQQPAELFRAGHVERAGLELQVRENDAHVASASGIQPGNAGDGAAWRNPLR